jgi:hypothetical protein
MPGAPTHFRILDLAVTKMAGLNDVTAIHKTIQANSEWAHLGALGPMLADYIPGNTSGNQYLNIWSQIYSVIGDGMQVTKGVLHIVRDIRNFLDTIQPILDAEDLNALKALPSDELNIVHTVGADLKSIFDSIPSVVLPIGAGIVSGMKPAVDVPLGNSVPPSQFWKIREYLCWKKPGSFTQTLLKNMSGSGDERFLAYAYGWLVSYVAQVCGAPFISSIVRGTYRTHWWRWRWVSNYIDAWAYGKYESNAIPGDTPNPDYPSWPSLCGADLHKLIQLGDHDPNDLMVRLYLGNPLSDAPTLPDSFGDLWVKSFNDTYNPPSPVSSLTAGSLNDAYLLAWLTLWFQTAHDGMGCNVPPPMDAPDDNCGVQPPWVSPQVTDQNGTPTVPVPDQPTIESQPDVAEIISGVLLALFGLGEALVGDLTDGGAGIAGGIQLIIDGASQINWGELRCYVYWYRLYLYHALDALHEILTAAAFRFPSGPELAQDQFMSLYFPTYLSPFDTGKNLTKSRACGGNQDCPHPSKPWTPTGIDWMNPPTAFETNYTTAYGIATYPDFFIDNAGANPLSNGEVRIGGTWPVRTIPGKTNVQPVQFGNAVDNVIDIFRHLDEAPNWNLDADRGMAYFTWEFLNGVYIEPVGIQPEP